MLSKAKIVIVLLSAAFVGYGLIGGMLHNVSAKDDAYRDLSIFTNVLNKVKEEYVEKPDLSKGIQGALQGMMEALDPYSSFVDAETYRELKDHTKENSVSIGAILSKRYGYAYVVSVVRGSPAEQGGLRTGDIIEAIDGQVTTEMSSWEASRRLAGKEGTSVQLRTIRGSRRTAPSQMELVRRKLAPPEVSARILEDGIGLLRVPHFDEGATEEVTAKLKMLQSSGIEGLLIDVRGTALGLFKEAVQISDLFVPKGKEILTVRDRNGEDTQFFSLTEPLISGIPVMLLIDGGTSGPAEVLAAALMDHKVARSVGEKTDGRGSQQEYFPLENGAVLHISTKLFYRATGTAIQGPSLKEAGITPDVRSPDEEFITSFYFEHSSEDPERSLGDEFYRKLSDTVQEEQLREGLRQLKIRLNKVAA